MLVPGRCGDTNDVNLRLNLHGLHLHNWADGQSIISGVSRWGKRDYRVSHRWPHSTFTILENTCLVRRKALIRLDRLANMHESQWACTADPPAFIDLVAGLFQWVLCGIYHLLTII